MKCKLNYKLGILLVITILLVVIMIKKSKTQEKFNLFRNDPAIKIQIANHDTLMETQQKQERILQTGEDQRNQVNELNNIINQLRQRFLLLKQLL